MKSFKESIEDKDIIIESIVKKEKGYNAVVNFEGNYVDLLGYFKRVSDRKLIINNYKIIGEVDNLLVKINLE